MVGNVSLAHSVEMLSFTQFISLSGPLVVAVGLTQFIWRLWRALQANASFPGVKTRFVFIAPSALATRLFSFGVPGLAWVNEWTWRGRYEGKVSNLFFSLHLSTHPLGLFGGSLRDIVAVQSVYPTTKPCLLIADPVTVKVCPGTERNGERLTKAPRQLDRVTPDFPSHMPSLLPYNLLDPTSLGVKVLSGDVIGELPIQVSMNQTIDSSGIRQ